MKNLEQNLKCIRLYNAGMSCTEIGTLLKLDRHKVSAILKQSGIAVINRHNLCKFNEHIFDSIDTEEKAYWLGFIFADGYISSKRASGKAEYRFEISLKGSDIEHLNKFNKFTEHIKNNVKFGYAKCNGVICKKCRWCISNKHLWEVLNSYGCTPKKSLTLKFPNILIFKFPDLVYPFIRGYFDGDGTITYDKFKTKNGMKYSGIAKILGTREFLLEIAKILNLPYRLSKNHGSDYTLSLNYSQTSTRKIIKLLYNNSNIYLNRKYNRAIFFMDKCRSEKEFSELLASEIGETPVVDNTEVISEISKGLEIPLSVESE